MPGYADESLSFSPDGKWIAAGGHNDANVLTAIWDVASGEKIHEWKWAKNNDPHSNITDLCFSSDSRKLAVANFRQRRGFVLDLDSKEQLFSFKHPGVYGLSFDSTNQTLVTVGWDSSIKHWDVETGEVDVDKDVNFPRQGQPDYESDLRMYSIRYSPNGQTYATQHMRAITRIWKTSDGEMMSENNPNTSVDTGTLSYSHDGLWLATGDRKGVARIYDTLTGKVIMTKQAHPDAVISMHFPADGQTLLTGGSEGVSYLWSLRPEQETQEEQSIDELSLNLFSDNSMTAFQAHWALLEQPEATISLFKKQLLDSDNIDPNSQVFLRAVAVLNTMNTDDSGRLLKSIGDKYPDDLLGREANRLHNR